MPSPKGLLSRRPGVHREVRSSALSAGENTVCPCPIANSVRTREVSD